MKVSAEELVDLMRSARPHAVVDVRERGAFERGHIFRAMSVPRRLLAVRMASLVTARETPIVLCDEGESLAKRSEGLLVRMGYRNVRILEGGLAAWRAGRPLAQGINVPSKVFGEEVLHGRGTPEISVADFLSLREAGANLVVVDVRTPEEYRRGCIPGAIGVPGAELLERAGDLATLPGATLVVHCGGRTRSYIATETLRELALKNRIVALRNGTMGWQLAGLELERGAERRAPAPTPEGRRAALGVARRAAASEGVCLISGKDALQLWRSRDVRDVYLVDVRTDEEYVAGHAAGATWAPGGQAIQATDDYFAVRGASFVFMCDGQARSLMTATWFRRMGIADVAVVEGGIDAWTRAGGEVEQGRPAPVPFGYSEAVAKVRALLPAGLQERIAAGSPPLVVSVDPSDVYAQRHVPGAGWVCASRVEDVLGDATLAGREVVVTCVDGMSSVLAALALQDAGRSPVAYLSGGVNAWSAAGHPVAKGNERLLDRPDDVVPKPYDRGRKAMESYLRWEAELRPDGTSSYDLFTWAKETQ